MSNVDTNPGPIRLHTTAFAGDKLKWFVLNN